MNRIELSKNNEQSYSKLKQAEILLNNSGWQRKEERLKLKKLGKTIQFKFKMQERFASLHAYAAMQCSVQATHRNIDN